MVISAGILFTVVGKLTSTSQAAYGQANTVATESFSSIRTIASLGIEQKMIDRYILDLKPALRAGIRRANFSGLGIGAAVGIFYFTVRLFGFVWLF